MVAIDARPRHRLTRDRAAVSAVFVAFGMVLGTWAAHVPFVKQTIGASSSEMGSILFILGAGALVGMQASGYAVDRFGSGRVAIVAIVAMALALIPPLVLSTWPAEGVAAALLGIAIGVGEVGINAAAVHVERRYQRPIMASFHGMFSIGTVIGASLAASAFAADVSVRVTAVAVASLAVIVCVPATLTLSRWTVTHGGEPVVDTAAHSADQSPPKRSWRAIVLGALAFLLLLTEGSAMDWSSLHAQQHLGVGSSSAALALTSFVAAMTVGRFSIDRVAGRVGPVRIVRWGSAVAVGALIVVSQAQTAPVLYVGWILLGVGLSGCVPQVFTAAGNLPGASAKTLSRVVGAGYLAVLGGPAVVGWLADLTSLNTALVLPTAAMVICAFAASTVAPPRSTS